MHFRHIINKLFTSDLMTYSISYSLLYVNFVYVIFTCQAVPVKLYIVFLSPGYMGGKYADRKLSLGFSYSEPNVKCIIINLTYLFSILLVSHKPYFAVTSFPNNRNTFKFVQCHFCDTNKCI